MKTYHKKYTVEVNGSAIPVSREVYEVYQNERSRNRNRQKRDRRNGLVSYHNLDTEDMTGEEIVFDGTEETLSELAERELMADKLHTALAALDRTETDIIRLLFFENMTVRDAAKRLDIPTMTLHSKKQKILVELHKVLKK